tara:strand:- start:315 stop:593 length:279 start_codon:yes stop_codon:yes gene_type:complete
MAKVEVVPPLKHSSRERWTFRSLLATPDVETGTPTGSQRNDLAGLIIIVDVLIRCIMSLVALFGLPWWVAAPVICCLFVAMIVLIIVLVWAT